MRFPFLFILGSVSFLGVCVASVQLPIAHLSSSAQAEVMAQADPLVGNVGTVNPSETVKITVVNNTPIPLFAGISGGSRVELAPRGTTTLQFDATPINVFVYPASGNASLQFDTTVVSNVVTVQVTQIGNNATPGDRAINIDPPGTVYVY